ncbi:DNA adenine methylase [Ureibacillus sp. FSL W8-0352]|uniref:DNA adenine methylase n=1 Tax=Ureibacillus sp. FSL W8-0352 TaxID=2954596 RepID=UPI0030FA603E
MDNLQPFLKWAGGKRQLLPEIRKYYPKKYNTYYEPFVGAGAVLFDLKPANAVINDTNKELINVYKVIKDSIKLEELINDLKKYKNDSDYYYEIRNLDREDTYKSLEDYKKASRFIYLNKTCFNGLYRVNSKGQFNVPFGKYKNPDYVNEAVLRAVHEFLNQNNIKIFNLDFEEVVEDATYGDFVYFDPPYHPVSKTSSFTSYTDNGFGKEDQERLRDTFERLYNKGCYVLLSNSDTEFIREIYSDLKSEGVTILEVDASRSINSKADKRGKVKEVLIIGDGTKKNKERQGVGETISKIQYTR